MALAFSVLTPSWLLQVSDAPGGTLRTLRVQRSGAPGLLTWAGPVEVLDGLCEALAGRTARDPADLAEQIRLEATARVPDAPATALLAGWGTSPEGHRGGFRWRVTNFEDDTVDQDDTFTVDGTWLVQSYAQPGTKGRGKARQSFSVQVSATDPLPADVDRGLSRLGRDLRKDPPPTELALELAGWVGQARPGPVLLALLRPDGALEGGVLEDGSLRPVQAPDEDGLHRLT
jgi:hypothetical protein